MTVIEHKKELDKGLWNYIKTNPIHEMIIDKCCEIIDNFVEWIKPFGLFLLHVMTFPIKPILYYPILIVNYYIEKKETNKRVEEFIKNPLGKSLGKRS